MIKSLALCAMLALGAAVFGVAVFRLVHFDFFLGLLAGLVFWPLHAYNLLGIVLPLTEEDRASLVAKLRERFPEQLQR